MADYYEEFGPGALPAVKPLEEGWYEKEESKKQEVGISELIGPAFRTTPTSKLTGKAAELYYRPAVDHDFEMSEETNAELNAKYDKDSADYIKEATSSRDLQYRKSIVDSQLEDMRTLAKGGLTGTALILGANLVDPVSLAVTATSGSLGIVAEATGMAKVARAAGVAGVESAIIEGVVAAGDPHYKWQNFVLNTALGSLMGGAFNIRAGIRSAREAAEDALLDAASTIKAESLIRDHEEALTVADAGMDMQKIQADIDARTRDIRERSKGSMPKSVLKAEKKKLKKLEAEYDANYKSLKQMQKDMNDLRNQSIEARKEYIEGFNKEKAKIDEKYDGLMKAAKERIAKAEKQLAKATGKKQVRANARYWEAGNALDILKEQYAVELKSAQTRHGRAVRRADNNLKREFDSASSRIRQDQQYLSDQITRKRIAIRQAGVAKASKRDQAIWEGLTKEERIKALYGDKVPMRTKTPVEATNKWVSQEGLSAGAAATSDFPSAFRLTMDDVSKFRDWGAIGEKIPEALSLMKTKAMRAASSMSNLLSTSKSMEMRGLSSKILQNPNGGHMGPNIDILAHIEDRTMRAAARGRVEPAFEGWMKLKGNNVKDIIVNPEFRDNFNRQVYLAIHDPSTAADKFVREAAEAYADIFETALTRMKKYGVKAFKDIEPSRTYVPRIINDMKLKQALTNKRLVKELLTKGYMEGDYKLPRKAAEAIADAHIYRSSHNSLTLMESANKAAMVNSSDLAEMLRASGVPSDIIDDMVNMRLETQGEIMMQDRARLSLGINPSSELEGNTVADLLETNLPSLSDRYIKDSAYDTALARMGWESRAQLENDLEILNKGMINAIPYTGQTHQEIAKEMQILRDGLTLIQGRSIDKSAGTTLGKVIRRLQGYTGLLRLNQIGISTIPEAARVWSTRPWYMMMDAIPHLRVFGSKGMRGGKWEGRLERADWDEMDTVLQYAGDDHVLYGNGLRSEVLEEGLNDSRIGKIIDNALNYGKHAQGIASGFRMIQGGLERYSVTSIGTKITDSALKGNKLFTAAEKASAGWSDEFFESVMDHVRTKGKTHTLSSGKVINTINVEDMSSEMFDRFQLGVHLLASREMQKLYVGETPRYMHTMLGSLLTQFRSFSIGSLEKQLMYDVKHNRSRGMLIALTSVFLAGLSYGTKTMLNGIGRPDAEDYIQNRLTGQNLAWGIIGSMGQLSIIDPAMDIAATIGIVPDTLLASPGKKGAAPLGVRSIPALGVASDIAKTTQDLFGTIRGNNKDINLVKDIRSLMIFNNMVGLNQLYNMIE
jgi:hypothetical protein